MHPLLSYTRLHRASTSYNRAIIPSVPCHTHSCWFNLVAITLAQPVTEPPILVSSLLLDRHRWSDRLLAVVLQRKWRREVQGQALPRSHNSPPCIVLHTPRRSFACTFLFPLLLPPMNSRKMIFEPDEDSGTPLTASLASHDPRHALCCVTCALHVHDLCRAQGLAFAR